MKKCRNQKGSERLTDAIAYRISASRRAFLERIAEEKNVGLCEAARIVLDKALSHAEDLFNQGGDAIGGINCPK